MRSRCESCGRRVESSTLLPEHRHGTTFWLCFECAELHGTAEEVPERKGWDG